MKERRLFIFCSLFLLAAFLAVHLGGDRFLEELRKPPVQAAFREDDTVLVEGQVWKQEERAEYHVFYLRDNSITKSGRTVEEAGIILYDPEKTDLRTGNILRASGQLFFFDEARNPGNFDQQFYYQRQNIHAGLWAQSVEVKDDSFWHLRDTLERFRGEWRKALLEAAGEKDGDILAAMILGDRQGMDPETKELYQVNGIAHILSISGLHLSFIGIGSYQLLRRRTGSYLAGGLLGIGFLLLYILMIGTGVAVLRSLVMFLLRVGADMAGRAYDMITALAAAAAVVILWQPLAFYDGGFQMSFGAILGMWILGELMRPSGKERQAGRGEDRRPEKEKSLPVRAKKGLVQALQSSLGVQMILLPVTLYHYFEFPLCSVFLNLLVIPLMSALLFLGMTGSLLYMAVEPAGQALVWMGSRILDIYEVSCLAALSLPGSRLVTGQPDMGVVWFYYLTLGITIVLWVLAKKKKRAGGRESPAERRRALVPVFAGAAVLLFAGPASGLGSLGQVEITMLDVGQGDSSFIRADDGTAILVDGGSSDTDQAGRYRVEPFLKAEGVGVLDYVFVTHGDSDHMNAVEELLDRQETGVKVSCLVLPVPGVWDEELKALAGKAKSRGVPVAVMDRGGTLSCGSLTVTCLQPGEEDEMEPGNGASLVLDISCGDFDMLLTGDVEGEGEEALEQRLKKTYDVLKTAHHGSRNSTSESFLQKASPSAALISAGRDNRYGHPHQETVDRLRREGCSVYQTAQSGSVTIVTDGRTMRIRRFLP